MFRLTLVVWLLFVSGAAAAQWEKEELSPEGRTVMERFWSERAAAAKGKPDVLDARKQRRELIVAALKAPQPDLPAIFKLIDEDEKANRAEQAESSKLFREMIQRLPPQDQLIYLHNLYREIPPPRISVSQPR